MENRHHDSFNKEIKALKWGVLTGREMVVNLVDEDIKESIYEKLYDELEVIQNAYLSNEISEEQARKFVDMAKKQAGIIIDVFKHFKRKKEEEEGNGSK